MDWFEQTARVLLLVTWVGLAGNLLYLTWKDR